MSGKAQAKFIVANTMAEFRDVCGKEGRDRIRTKTLEGAQREQYILVRQLSIIGLGDYERCLLKACFP